MNDLNPDLGSSNKFSAIWIIPLVAMAIGIYLVIHTMMTEGPEITITFDNAEGLEAGKTKLRYRNVVIGLVEEVTLSESLDTIVVTAKMNLEAKPMLREDSRFWVVRARVGAGGITGLGTIFSGAYIELDPGSGAAGKREFVGLELPPLTPAEAPGVRLVLTSENAASLSAGDAILYNGFKVGRIEAVSFDSDTKEVTYNAFIDAPYDDLVTTSSRFWNISGVELDASAAGIRVDTGSFQTILLGGVAFGSLPGAPPGQKAVSGARYKLNASYSELRGNPYRYGFYQVAEFSQSLRGLEPGAPVSYRGIPIGRVERILLKEFAREKMGPGGGRSIPVLIYLEPGRTGLPDSRKSVGLFREVMADSVTKGLRATLETGNLLTGKLFIGLDFYDDVAEVAAKEFDGYPVIPSIPSGLGRIEHQVSALLDKLNGLPLDDTVAKANAALGTLDGTLASLQDLLGQDSTRQLTGELNSTLEELRKTLGGLTPGSPTGQSLRSSIYELNSLLRNLTELTSTLKDKPNAAVFPTDMPDDPIPEARAR